MLTIKNLSYRIKDKLLLDDIVAEFRLGQVSGILGSNGAGKSTLLKIISGENPDYSGAIYLNNQLLRDFRLCFPANMRAIVSQHENIMSEISVTEYVLLGRLSHSLGHYQIADYQSVERALAYTNSLTLAHKNLNQLSGGERQRVQLARSLAQLEKAAHVYSGYLFLDEFSANMDIYYQQQMLELLQYLSRQQQLAIIIIAHDLNQVANYFDYCILLKQGRCIASGTPQQVLNPHNIERVYNIKAQQIMHNKRHYFIY